MNDNCIWIQTFHQLSDIIYIILSLTPKNSSNVHLQHMFYNCLTSIFKIEHGADILKCIGYDVAVLGPGGLDR